MFAREIPDKETALSAILEELEKRYGEKFHQTHETQVVEKAYPEKGEKKYDFLLNRGCGRKVGPSRAVGLEFACIAKRT